jgi:carbamoyl-phosphate synthase large subunit
MALAYKVPIITTIAGGLASLEAVRGLKHSPVEMIALQDFFVQGKKQVSVNQVPSSAQHL